MINPITLNDRYATDAISRIVFPCWCSLITNCSLSHLFNTACNVCFVWDIIDSFFCLLLVVIIGCYHLLFCTVLSSRYNLDENGARNFTVYNYYHCRCYCYNRSNQVCISIVFCDIRWNRSLWGIFYMLKRFYYR